MQLDDAASDEPQVPPVTAKSPALTPPMFAPVSVIDPVVALLFTVRFNVFDAVWYTLAKTSFVADSDSGTVAIALNETVYGPSGSGLSVTVKVADSTPTAVGAKVTITEQAVLAASVEVQVPPVTLKSPALAPPKPSLSETALLW